MTATDAPVSSNFRIKPDPINPAPPVTTHLLILIQCSHLRGVISGLLRLGPRCRRHQTAGPVIGHQKTVMFGGMLHHGKERLQVFGWAGGVRVERRIRLGDRLFEQRDYFSFTVVILSIELVPFHLFTTAGLAREDVAGSHVDDHVPEGAHLRFYAEAVFIFRKVLGHFEDLGVGGVEHPGKGLRRGLRLGRSEGCRKKESVTCYSRHNGYRLTYPVNEPMQLTVWKFVGGRVCLDFVNTVGGRVRGVVVRDRLRGYEDLLAWSEAAGLITESEARILARRATPRTTKAIASRAMALRQAIYLLFRPGRDTEALTILNREVAVARRHE